MMREYWLLFILIIIYLNGLKTKNMAYYTFSQFDNFYNTKNFQFFFTFSVKIVENFCGRFLTKHLSEFNFILDILKYFCRLLFICFAIVMCLSDY